MRAAAAVLVVMLGVAACGGDGGGSTATTLSDKERAAGAQSAVTEQLGLVTSRQFGLLWEQIHPAQQELIPKDLYVKCAKRYLSTADFETVRFTEAYAKVEPIAGTDESGDAIVVTVEVMPSTGGSEQLRYTEFDIEGGWRMALENIRPFTHGKCPK